MLETLDKLFFKVINERDSLIKKSSNSYRDEIIKHDLKISIYIKKRAKITEGGYNFILEEMWNWKPFFPIDRRLLPKITRC